MTKITKEQLKKIEKQKEKDACPPYNTGSAFEYYDYYLEHSTWLNLMKPRLKLLRNLLSNDGSIFVRIDNKESAYLKVLCDEVFGRRNFITSFSIQVRHLDRMLKGDKDIHDIVENIHFYQKSNDFKINKRKKEESEEEGLSEYIWEVEIIGDGEDIKFGGKNCKIFKQGQFKLIKSKPNEKALKKINIRGV